MSKKCVWKQNIYQYPDEWDTECGHCIHLEDMTMAESKLKYCCYCGKRVKTIPWREDSEETGAEK